MAKHQNGEKIKDIRHLNKKILENQVKRGKRKFIEFRMSRGIPADASGAYWTDLRANNRIFARDISSAVPRIPTRY